jgi:hypothetical protein
MTSTQRGAVTARARRARPIRRRVVAATLATFALAWGVIAFHGSMGAQRTASAHVSTTDRTSANATSSSSDQPGAVTTSQS